MRKIYFLFIMLALFAAGETNAQISVTGGSGLAATYSSFTKAGGLFEAINLTAQTGNNILVTITANINNEDGAISLNAGAWSTISIKPSGGTARTISGAVTAGLPMINFNGADNVTIDGLNTGGNSLTISNTTVSATAGTSTIKFFGDANNNTITNCSILGSSTTAAASNGGNIWFSAGAVTTGNDGNTISNCNIGAAGANLASK
ncbi:MAG: hypothetical protein IPP72_14075 [Chitinophagaceae bacterium]|nr:hypothetical protein [Chitinophagaceae bacterium]